MWRDLSKIDLIVSFSAKWPGPLNMTFIVSDVRVILFLQEIYDL